MLFRFLFELLFKCFEMKNRIQVNVTFVAFFIWSLYLPAYSIIGGSTRVIQATSFLESYFQVEALIIYSWIPSVVLILFRLANWISEEYRTRSIRRWQSISIHIFCFLYLIVDLAIHYFHFDQVPLISVYLSVCLIILSYCEVELIRTINSRSERLNSKSTA